MKTVRTSMSGHTEIDIPYSFTCNYCGKRNNKVCKEWVIGSFSKSGSWQGPDADQVFERGLENNLEENAKESVKRKKRELDAFTERVRAGDGFKPIRGGATGLHIPTLPSGFDGVCDACGKRQAWDFWPILKEAPEMPANEEPKWKGVLGVILLIVAFVVPIVLLVLALAFESLPIRPAIIAAGICFLTGIIALLALSPSHEAEKRAKMEYQSNYLMEKLGSEPNLPENLPIILLDEGSEGIGSKE